MLVTVYRCSRCKSELPYSKAFLENGNMVAECPKCGSHIIIEANVSCPLCSNPAECLSMKIHSTAANGTTSYKKELRCHLHEGCDDIQNEDNNADPKMSSVFKCANCHMTSRYSKASLSITEGILHAVCPECGADCSLQEGVKCQYPNCGKTAVHCKPDKSMCSGYAMLCDEHKDMKVPKCFIATAACGSEMAAEVVLLRKYRDTVLRKSGTGRTFIKVYESVSPPVARAIASSRFLKGAVRAVIVRPAASFAGKALKNKDGAN